MQTDSVAVLPAQRSKPLDCTEMVWRQRSDALKAGVIGLQGQEPVQPLRRLLRGSTGSLKLLAAHRDTI